MAYRCRKRCGYVSHTVTVKAGQWSKNLLAVPILVSIAVTIFATLKDTKSAKTNKKAWEGNASRFLRCCFLLSCLNHPHCLVTLSVYWATPKENKTWM